MKLVCSSIALALLGACVAPMPAPAPAPAARLSPAPAPRAGAAIDWHDMPATPGVWQWHREGRLTVARFGDPDQAWLFSMICDPGAGTIGLARSGLSGAPATMSIATTSLVRALAVSARGDVALSARDPLLDAMAYSQGRFAVRATGMASLYLPSWPEVGRVIEDCRLSGSAPP